jgi:hypothetical protein
VHCGCDRGLIFRKNNSRSDSVFNKWRKLLDQENRRNTLICIEISTLLCLFYNDEEPIFKFNMNEKQCTIIKYNFILV